MNKANNHRAGWFVFAVLAMLLGVPNGVAVKIGLEHTDPIVFNSLRYALVAIVSLPLIWLGRSSISRKNIKYAIYTAISMIIVTGSYVKAFSEGSVSYLSLFNLVTPIVFIVLSVLMMREKLKREALLGMAIAGVGAFVLIGLPAVANSGVGGSTSESAIFYALIETVLYPLIILFPKKADEKGLPLMLTFAIAGTITAVFNFLLVVGFGKYNELLSAFSLPQNILAGLYSAVISGFIAKWMNVVAYEKLGSILISSLSYLQYVLAVVFPMILLGESLPWLASVSGVLILIGVIVAERYHPSAHIKYFKAGYH